MTKTSTTLFDAHCHLQDERIYGSLDTILIRAHEQGIRGLLCCGSTVADWKDVKAINGQYRHVIPAFGLHPWYVDEAPVNWREALRAHLAATPSAVGEIGLDYKLSKCDPALQRNAMEYQMQLAAELSRPVSIHCLKAWHDLIPILKHFQDPLAPVQLHSYNGGPKLLEQLLELNCYFSFSGSLTRHRNTKAHKALALVPRDRILIETDAPDIPPEIDGAIDFDTPNEPATLPHVFNKAAELLQMPPEDLERQLSTNARAFLGPLWAYYGEKEEE